MYFVYILQCRDKSLYTGITTDIKRRFKEHKAGTGGHYTRARGALKIVYQERKRNRSTASKREAEIKSLSRAAKLALSLTYKEDPNDGRSSLTIVFPTGTLALRLRRVSGEMQAYSRRLLP
jgi:putative endonuclease